MHDAALVFRFGICRSNCFFDSTQPIGTDDQDIFYSAVFQFIQHGKPVLWALIFAHLNGQNLFLTVHVDSKNDISCQLPDHPIIPDRIMNCIDIKHRINFRQRTFLPVFNLGQDFVCDIGNEAFWGFKTIDILQGFWNLPGRHSLCIHGDDFLVNGGDIFLTFADNLWLKRRFPILRNLNIHCAIAAVNPFALIPIAVVVTVRALRFLITKVFVHLSFHHFFDRTAQKVF